MRIQRAALVVAARCPRSLRSGDVPSSHRRHRRHRRRPRHRQAVPAVGHPLRRRHAPRSSRSSSRSAASTPTGGVDAGERTDDCPDALGAPHRRRRDIGDLRPVWRSNDWNRRPQIGSGGPVSIVAVSSDGTLTTLEKSVAGSPSVVGRDDGQAWAWAVQTNSPACGSSTRATFDIYTDDGNGARKIGSASFGAGVTQVGLVAWTAAGIVASGDNMCGGGGDPLDLGDLTGHPHQSSDGRGHWSRRSHRNGLQFPGHRRRRDDRLFRWWFGTRDSGRHARRQADQIQHSGADVTAVYEWRGGAFSRCQFRSGFRLVPPTASVLQLVLLDLASGHVVVVTGASDLAPTLWTPDDLLIATDFGGQRPTQLRRLGWQRSSIPRMEHRLVARPSALIA